ncbi:unnamed protein product [Clonostachys rhizophaga]|uniref:Uncharacterized protein n=1 Tax=Clonostachys rhizophaga TaxID=160324 RepID=A0A9N9YJ04_9HYPO|nr:unnamed protein product [Clonostachys rhizophaga]
MSHITLAQQGMAAVENRAWDEAITKLSVALEQSANPGWLIGRSKALVAVSRFREALEDADLAWHSAFQRNKRDLMIEAHYRRAVAYFRLGEFANADCCCVYSMRLAKGKSAVEKEDPVKDLKDEEGRWAVTAQQVKDEIATDEFNQQSNSGSLVEATQAAGESVKQWRRASTFRLQAISRLQKLPEDDPARIATATLQPPKKALAKLGGDDKKKAASKAAGSSAATAPAVAKPQVPADTPVRLQDFQNDSTMSVTIFSKGVNKEKLQVEFLQKSVRLDPIIYPSGDEKAFKLSLWGEIDTAASKYTVTPSKVELSLKKKSPGKWPQLKGEGNDDEPSAEEKMAEAREKEILEHLKESRKKAMDEADEEAAEKEKEKAEVPTTAPVEEKEAEKAPVASSGPSYPTSSKSGPKNWDKIEGVDSDEEEGDVNIFFKKLYKNATPEQQRAMMKSFTESNGTSLSTDWNDVKARKVETVPPDGVEAKKW